MSPSQLPKLVGMALAAVVVPARNSGHQETASAEKRASTRLLWQLSDSCGGCQRLSRTCTEGVTSRLTQLG